MPAPPRDLAFRADGAQIAVLYDEQKNLVCRISEADTGRLVRSFPLPIGGIASIAWSPDGATLAIAGDDRKIHLLDALTGTRKSTLEGFARHGITSAFHPAGTILASNSDEDRLRLWDPVLGRPWLSVLGGPGFVTLSQDGRIVLRREDKLTTYHIDPAQEYRTFAHVVEREDRVSTPVDPARRPRAGRGHGLGVCFSGTLTWARSLRRCQSVTRAHVMFEASGDLLTSGPSGVNRWPAQLDLDHSQFRIGPPKKLPLPAGHVCDRRGPTRQDCGSRTF